MTATSTELHPAMVLGAYVASHVEGKRVALLGDCRTGLAEQLVQLTGRRLHVYDIDPDRIATSIAEATRGAHRARISFNVLEDDLDFREGAFDVALVPDLSLFEDFDTVVALAESLVGQRGLAFFGVENNQSTDDDAVGYYELYDLVSNRFENVRMLGQADFFGSTVADFAAENEPPVTIDSSLMSHTSEPTHFIAVASGAAIALDPYTLVQLPPQSENDAEPQPADESFGRMSEDESSLVEEIDKLKEQLERYERLARERKQTATQLSTRVAELEADLDQTRAENQQLRDDAGMAASLKAELDSARHEIAQRAAAPPIDNQDEMARFESVLQERAEKLKALQQALDESERVGRALANELNAVGQTKGQPQSADDAQASPAMERLARYEADLQSAQWRIEALQSELAERDDPKQDHDALEIALTAAQATIAAMQTK